MTSDEDKIREDIYDDLYAIKRSPLAKEIIREAARQFEGVYKSWTRRVLDTTNYDHVMTTFEEVLDEVAETYVYVELAKIEKKQASRPFVVPACGMRTDCWYSPVTSRTHSLCLLLVSTEFFRREMSRYPTHDEVFVLVVLVRI